MSWAGAGLSGLPTPLLVLGAGIMHGNLLLLLESQKQRLVLAFLHLVPNLPQLHMPANISHPLVSLDLLLMETFVQVQTLQEGSQVPVCLNIT